MCQIKILNLAIVGKCCYLLSHLQNFYHCIASAKLAKASEGLFMQVDIECQMHKSEANSITREQCGKCICKYLLMLLLVLSLVNPWTGDLLRKNVCLFWRPGLPMRSSITVRLNFEFCMQMWAVSRHPGSHLPELTLSFLGIQQNGYI